MASCVLLSGASVTGNRLETAGLFVSTRSPIRNHRTLSVRSSLDSNVSDMSVNGNLNFTVCFFFFICITL